MYRHTPPSDLGQRYADALWAMHGHTNGFFGLPQVAMRVYALGAFPFAVMNASGRDPAELRVKAMDRFLLRVRARWEPARTAPNSQTLFFPRPKWSREGFAPDCDIRQRVLVFGILFFSA
jgi:hypothetical protein